MKKTLLCITFSLFLFSGFSQSVLWKISGKKLSKPSYLFGTIHLQSKEVFELSDSLLPAINNADKLALELNFNELDPMQLIGMMMLPPGKTLKTVLSEEEFSIIEKAFLEQTGMSIEPFIGMKPFSLLTFIMLSNMDEGENAPAALDQFLSYYAASKKIDIYGIETVEEQMKVLDAMPNEALIETLTEEDSVNLAMDSLLLAYGKGDLETVANFLEEDKSYGKWMDKLIDERNEIMFQRTFEFIKKGESLVIAVGTGHLPGKKGLINLYRKKGYTVTPVLGAKSQITDEVWEEVLKHKKF